jgi:hypothetical protein
MRKNLTRRKRTVINDDVLLSITQMFEGYILVKKGEGLAKRTIADTIITSDTLMIILIASYQLLK